MPSGLAMYAGAAVLGTAGAFIPGGPTFSSLPGVAAVVIIALLGIGGFRVPRRWLFALGPLGVVLIAYALGSADGYSDAAVLYAWPVLWVACFFGTRATIAVVVWVGVAHAGALWALPPGLGGVDRWFDVMVSVGVIGAVVRALALRNRRLVADLAAEARLDPLTGLLNRRGLNERLEVEITRARRDLTPIAAVALDIDRFKAINDTFGHDVGDRVLTSAARTMTRATRGSDLVARLGGDEFLLVLPGADADQAREVADRIRNSVQGDVRDAVVVSVSVGVAVAVAPVDGHGLVQAADRALYAAKQRGRNATATARRQVAACASR